MGWVFEGSRCMGGGKKESYVRVTRARTHRHKGKAKSESDKRGENRKRGKTATATKQNMGPNQKKNRHI